MEEKNGLKIMRDNLILLKDLLNKRIEVKQELLKNAPKHYGYLVDAAKVWKDEENNRKKDR